MNVYRIEYTHHWIGEPAEVLTWHVLGESVDEALETWRSGGHLGGELQDKDPDSIACLGEAILPARGAGEGIRVTVSGCSECGAGPGSEHNPGCAFL